MSEAKDGLELQIEDQIATITINRPERRNAIGPLQMEGLVDRFETVKAEDDARVVVLTGAGDRAFCAGGDLGGMTGEGVLGMHEARGALVDLFRTMWNLGKPIVARINGYALGGGFGLAMACDLAIACETAKFGTPEIDVGLFPMMIMPVVFRNVSRKKGLEMILTGKKILASEAEELGLVNRVVPCDEIDDAVDELCGVLLEKSPAVLKVGRDAFYAMQDMNADQAFEYMKSMLTLNTMLEDAAIGVQAFLTKQKPEWKGR